MSSAICFNLDQSKILSSGNSSTLTAFSDDIQQLILFQTSADFYVSGVQVFSNAMGNGEIALNEQFFLLPLCFLPVWKTPVWKSLKFVIW